MWLCSAASLAPRKRLDTHTSPIASTHITAGESHTHHTHAHHTHKHHTHNTSAHTSQAQPSQQVSHTHTHHTHAHHTHKHHTHNTRTHTSHAHTSQKVSHNKYLLREALRLAAVWERSAAMSKGSPTAPELNRISTRKRSVCV